MRSPRSGGTGAAGGAPTVALALVAGFGPFGTDTYLPALPAVQEAFATSAAAAQATVTVFLVGLAIGQLLAGPVSDALGRRPLLIGGAVGLVASSVLCLVAQDIATLVAGRALQGAAAGVGAAVGIAVVSDRYSGAEAMRRLGTLSVIRLLGPVVAPAIGGVVLLVADFRAVFVVLAALSVVILLISVLVLPETLPRAARRSGALRRLPRTAAELLAQRAFLVPVVVQCIATAGFFVYIGGSAFTFQQDLGVGESVYAIVFGTNAAAMVVTSLLFRLLVVRVGPIPLRTVGLAMSAGAAAVLLVVEVAAGGGAPLAAVWTLLAVAVAGNGLCIPATTVLAQQAGRAAPGTAASLSGGLAFLVGACTTPLTGLLGTQTVLALAALMAGISGAALVLSVVAGRSSPR